MKKILFGILLAIIGGFLIICTNDDVAFWIGRIMFIVSIIIGISGLNEKER